MTLHLESVVGALREGYLRLYSGMNGYTIAERNPNYYPFIPVNSYQLSVVVEDMMKLKWDTETALHRFCDAGCGIPFVPYIIRTMFRICAEGVEYDRKLCEKLVNVKHGDILDFNFGSYDIVYAYSPISNLDLMEKGLHNMLTTMKSGAVLYFVKASPINMTKYKKYGRVKELLSKSGGSTSVWKVVKK